MVKVDEVVVVSVQLQFDWICIIVLIDGCVGLKQVDIGNQIFSGDIIGIVVFIQMYLIDVVFIFLESSIVMVVQVQKVGKMFSVEVWDCINKQKISVGELLSFDNQIDVIIGIIKLKVCFSNLDDVLFFNQFVNVCLLVDIQQNVVVIFVVVLQMGNEGYFVWVLNDENKVSKYSVMFGIQDSQKVVISVGFFVGDCVVIDGIDCLIEGVKVEVVIVSSGEQMQFVLCQSGKYGVCF